MAYVDCSRRAKTCLNSTMVIFLFLPPLLSTQPKKSSRSSDNATYLTSQYHSVRDNRIHSIGTQSYIKNWGRRLEELLDKIK